MKTLLTILLCLSLLGLCACGQVEPEQTTPPPTTAQTTQVLTTTQVPKIKPTIEYPVSYKDAPEAYKPILDDLYKFVYTLSNGLELDDSYSGKTGIAEIPAAFYRNGNFDNGSIGYAIKDINNDGIPELMLLNNDHYSTNEQFVLSLFTLNNDVPVFLEHYWVRSYARFAADGTIYNIGSGGAATTYLSKYKLEPDSTELTKLPGEYMSDWGPIFVEIIDDDRKSIAEKEFYKLLELYSNPPSPMKLNFIPIEQ